LKLKIIQKKITGINNLPDFEKRALLHITTFPEDNITHSKDLVKEVDNSLNKMEFSTYKSIKSYYQIPDEIIEKNNGFIKDEFIAVSGEQDTYWIAKYIRAVNKNKIEVFYLDKKDKIDNHYYLDTQQQFVPLNAIISRIKIIESNNQYSVPEEENKRIINLKTEKKNRLANTQKYRTKST